MLAYALSWFGEISHEGYHQLGDISKERVVGLYVLVEALHHEGGERGLLFCEVDDLLSQFDVGTNGDDDVFDEIVAVAEALILEQLCLGLPDLYGLCIIGADGLLDLSLHFYLLLLFFLDQEELFLELALQLAQDVPAVLLSYHVVDYNIIKYHSTVNQYFEVRRGWAEETALKDGLWRSLGFDFGVGVF